MAGIVQTGIEMLAVIVGGRLQGVEAAYLARKAGWRVMMVDREEKVPALGLCHQYLQMDITQNGALDKLPPEVGLVIPALENVDTLSSIHNGCSQRGIPVAFDLAAYAITVSKRVCARLFTHAGIPVPASWPGCGFPVVVKPSVASGSRGVKIFWDRRSLINAFPEDFPPADHVAQAYLPGPSFSLEVFGHCGVWQPLQVTSLEMDGTLDCKRVLAPARLPNNLSREFEELAIRLAREVKLVGVMDVEVILDKGALKVLEIDARLPSQTPIAVFHSCGTNMVELLGDSFAKGRCPAPVKSGASRSVILEHVIMTGDTIRTEGEHIMAVADPLKVVYDFFGADEAITNYSPGRTEWVATLICCGENEKSAWEKRSRTLERMKSEMGIGMVPDTRQPVQDGRCTP